MIELCRKCPNEVKNDGDICPECRWGEQAWHDEPTDIEDDDS